MPTRTTRINGSLRSRPGAGIQVIVSIGLLLCLAFLVVILVPVGGCDVGVADQLVDGGGRELAGVDGAPGSHGHSGLAVPAFCLLAFGVAFLCCVGCRDGLCPGGGALRAVWGVVAAASEVISGSVSGLVKQCRLM